MIGLYLGQASVGSTYGPAAAGSAVVLRVWIYYASLILFFGAKITQVMARIVPTTHAQVTE
jgi:membrane protein